MKVRSFPHCRFIRQCHSVAQQGVGQCLYMAEPCPSSLAALEDRVFSIEKTCFIGLQLMNQMRQKGLQPTKNTYLAALNAMAEVGFWGSGDLLLDVSGFSNPAALLPVEDALLLADPQRLVSACTMSLRLWEGDDGGTCF